ncbi:MAG TPA: hypothetical protein VEJ23_02160 [Solirubrobacteraceae bacterium]|nr:hypothetical protein [Solirubrobacteraceae bacterium]
MRRSSLALVALTAPALCMPAGAGAQASPTVLPGGVQITAMDTPTTLQSLGNRAFSLAITLHEPGPAQEVQLDPDRGTDRSSDPRPGRASEREPPGT